MKKGKLHKQEGEAIKEAHFAPTRLALLAFLHVSYPLASVRYWTISTLGGLVSAPSQRILCIL